MSKSVPPDLPNNPLLLERQLNHQHPLVKMAQAIDWDYFEIEFGQQIVAEAGRPRLATRLMVGLH
jgi:transposase, IS5 family